MKAVIHCNGAAYIFSCCFRFLPSLCCCFSKGKINHLLLSRGFSSEDEPSPGWTANTAFMKWIKVKSLLYGINQKQRAAVEVSGYYFKLLSERRKEKKSNTFALLDLLQRRTTVHLIVEKSIAVHWPVRWRHYCENNSYSRRTRVRSVDLWGLSGLMKSAMQGRRVRAETGLL